MTQCTLFLTCCRCFFFLHFFFREMQKNRLVIRRSREHGKHGTSAGLFALALIFTIHDKFNLFLSLLRSLSWPMQCISPGLMMMFACAMFFLLLSALSSLDFFSFSCAGDITSEQVEKVKKTQKKYLRIALTAFPNSSQHTTRIQPNTQHSVSLEIFSIISSLAEASRIYEREGKRRKKKSTLGQLVVACVLIRCSFGKC